MTRPIFFLTDFGLSDTYVGAVKAVILRIAPNARIVDLTHAVPPQDVRAGAFALLTAVPYLPDDAVVLAVVDPGVGTTRRSIAVQAAGRTFVGPDNGLLSWAIRGVLSPPSPLAGAASGEAGDATSGSNVERVGTGGRGRLELGPDGVVSRKPAPTPEPDVGAGFQVSIGATDNPNLPHSLPFSSQERASEGGEFFAVVLDRPRFWRPTLSVTFHGRDLFGPVAAHLARGVPLTEVGSPCDGIQTLPFPTVRRSVDAGGRTLTLAEIVHVDHYGNLISNLAATDLPPEPVFEIAGQTIVGLAPHFQAGPAGSLIALIGSAGLLEVAVPNGSAASLLGLGVGAAVTVIGRP